MLALQVGNYVLERCTYQLHEQPSKLGTQVFSTKETLIFNATPGFRVSKEGGFIFQAFFNGNFLIQCFLTTTCDSVIMVGG